MNAKHFLKSKAFWSCIIVILSAIGHMVQTGTVSDTDITAIIGALGGIYGRAVAEGPLTTATK